MRHHPFSLVLFSTALIATLFSEAVHASNAGDSCAPVARIQSYFVDIHLRELQEQGEWDEALSLLTVPAPMKPDLQKNALTLGKAVPSHVVSEAVSRQQKELRERVLQLKKDALTAEKRSADLIHQAQRGQRSWVPDRPEAKVELRKQALAAHQKAVALRAEAAALEKKLIPDLLATKGTQTRAQLAAIENHVAHLDRTEQELRRQADRAVKTWAPQPEVEKALKSRADGVRATSDGLQAHASDLKRSLPSNSMALQESQIRNRILSLQMSAARADQAWLASLMKQGQRSWIEFPSTSQPSALTHEARLQAAAYRSEIVTLEKRLASLPGSQAWKSHQLKTLATKSLSSQSGTNAAMSSLRSSVMRNAAVFVRTQIKGTLWAMVADAFIQVVSAGVGGRSPDHVLACQDMERCFDLAMNDPRKFCEYVKYDPVTMDNYTDGYLAILRMSDVKRQNSNERARRLLSFLVENRDRTPAPQAMPAESTGVHSTPPFLR